MKIKIFIIYIERSMGICIMCIGILGPLSCFDYINFKVSLVIKIINFQINHMISKHGSKYVKWHGSIYHWLSQRLKII